MDFAKIEINTRALEELDRDNGRERERILAKQLPVDPGLSEETVAEFRQAERAMQRAEAETYDLKVAQRAKALRELGLAALAEARQGLEAERYDAEQAKGPRTGDEWQIARARADFVRDEVEKLSPGEIVKRYQLAQQAGDRVGAYLLATMGAERLAQLSTSSEDLDRIAAASSARDQLLTLHLGDVHEKQKAGERRLEELERKLREPHGYRQRLAAAEEMRATFGLHLPATEMVDLVGPQ